MVRSHGNCSTHKPTVASSATGGKINHNCLSQVCYVEEEDKSLNLSRFRLAVTTWQWHGHQFPLRTARSCLASRLQPFLHTHICTARSLSGLRTYVRTCLRSLDHEKERKQLITMGCTSKEPITIGAPAKNPSPWAHHTYACTDP